MNRTWIVSLFAGAAIAALATAPSRAADLPQVAPTYATAPVAVSAYDWNGFYVGINGGWGWSSFHNNGGLLLGHGDGGLVGGTAGYNWQWGHLVAGLETDLDWADISARDNRAVLGPVGPVRANLDYLGTFRGRIGYAMDRVLFYGTGGLAYGGQSLHSAGTSAAKTTIGWTVGAGVEFAVWQNLSAKIEYKYVDLGRTTLSPAALGPTRVGFRGNILTAGINYKFW